MLKRQQLRRESILTTIVAREDDSDEASITAELVTNAQVLIDKLFRLSENIQKSDEDLAYIIKRREILESNKSLKDIFATFWLAVFHLTDNHGIMNKEGFLKFYKLIRRALLGKLYISDEVAESEEEWNFCSKMFGDFSGGINMTGFYDFLLELIETWTDIVSPTYYAAFAWSLLDSVTDTSIHPPRLRSERLVPCIMQVQDSVKILQKYMKDRDFSAALSINAVMLTRIPDVQKRLQARKYGAELSKDADLLYVLVRSRKESSADNDEESLDNVSRLNDDSEFGEVLDDLLTDQSISAASSSKSHNENIAIASLASKRLSNDTIAAYRDQYDDMTDSVASNSQMGDSYSDLIYEDDGKSEISSFKDSLRDSKSINHSKFDANCSVVVDHDGKITFIDQSNQFTALLNAKIGRQKFRNQIKLVRKEKQSRKLKSQPKIQQGMVSSSMQSLIESQRLLGQEVNYHTLSILKIPIASRSKSLNTLKLDPLECVRGINILPVHNNEVMSAARYPNHGLDAIDTDEIPDEFPDDSLDSLIKSLSSSIENPDFTSDRPISPPKPKTPNLHASTAEQSQFSHPGLPHVRFDAQERALGSFSIEKTIVVDKDDRFIDDLRHSNSNLDLLNEIRVNGPKNKHSFLAKMQRKAIAMKGYQGFGAVKEPNLVFGSSEPQFKIDKEKLLKQRTNRVAAEVLKTLSRNIAEHRSILTATDYVFHVENHALNPILHPSRVSFPKPLESDNIRQPTPMVIISPEFLAPKPLGNLSGAISSPIKRTAELEKTAVKKSPSDETSALDVYANAPVLADCRGKLIDDDVVSNASEGELPERHDSFLSLVDDSISLLSTESDTKATDIISLKSKEIQATNENLQAQSISHQNRSLINLLLDSKDLVAPSVSAHSLKRIEMGTYVQRRNRNGLRDLTGTAAGLSSPKRGPTRSSSPPLEWMDPKPFRAMDLSQASGLDSELQRVSLSTPSPSIMERSTSSATNLSYFNAELPPVPQLYVHKLSIASSSSGKSLPPPTNKQLDLIAATELRVQQLQKDAIDYSKITMEDDLRSQSLNTIYTTNTKETNMSKRSMASKNSKVSTQSSHLFSPIKSSLSIDGIHPSYAESFYEMNSNNPIYNLDNLASKLPKAAARPWLPGSLKYETVTDKSSHLLAWHDRKFLMNHSTHDPTEYRTIVRRQDAVREAFESYTRYKK